MDKLTLGSTKCAVGMNNRNSLSGFCFHFIFVCKNEPGSQSW